jgi:hypothetical protein
MGKSFSFCIFVQLSRHGGAGILRTLLKVVLFQFLGVNPRRPALGKPTVKITKLGKTIANGQR